MCMKTSQSAWAPRPLPEEISERLDTFFPDRDLNKPVIDLGGASSLAGKSVIPGLRNVSVDKAKKSKHKKSIRVVASEHHKKNEPGLPSDSPTMSSVTRKRNTKLWGSKLEEVTTSQISSVLPIPDSPTGPNPRRKLISAFLIHRF